MKLLLPMAALLVCMTTSAQNTASNSKLTTREDSVFYLHGVQIANYMIQNGIERIDTAALLLGMEEFLNNSTIYTTNRARNELSRISNTVERKNKLKSDKFLAENKLKPGVKTYYDNFQYKELSNKSTTVTANEAPKNSGVDYKAFGASGFMMYRINVVLKSQDDSIYYQEDSLLYKLNGSFENLPDCIGSCMTLVKPGESYIFWIPYNYAYYNSPPNDNYLFNRFVHRGSYVVCEVEVLGVERAIYEYEPNEEVYVTNRPNFNFDYQTAEYADGDAAIASFIKSNLNYPKEEKKKKVEGTVQLKVTIEKDGAMSDVSVYEGVPDGPNLAIEAERVFELMPKKFKAARKDDKPIKCVKTFPVVFELN